MDSGFRMVWECPGNLDTSLSRQPSENWLDVRTSSIEPGETFDFVFRSQSIKRIDMERRETAYWRS